MSKRIVLQKGNKIFIGIPTTVNKRLGKCDEQVRRWVRDNKGGGHFEMNGYEVFMNDKVEELKKNRKPTTLFTKCKRDGTAKPDGVYYYCNRFKSRCILNKCKRIKTK